MRIPRPKRLKPEFRRRGSPPPAARKLLTASLASGLILVVALAIVFVPRGLFYGSNPPLPRISLEVNASTVPWRVVVTAVTIVRPLAEYRAEYRNGASVAATIDPLEDGSVNGTLAFHDNGDGNLTAGDWFDLTYSDADSLQVFYRPQGARVGYWPAGP